MKSEDNNKKQQTNKAAATKTKTNKINQAADTEALEALTGTINRKDANADSC